jgi:hypothetical protein
MSTPRHSRRASDPTPQRASPGKADGHHVRSRQRFHSDRRSEKAAVTIAASLATFDAPDDPVCAECGCEPRDDENAADEWRAYLDVDNELPVFCPECAEREFGSISAAVVDGNLPPVGAPAG